MSVGWRIVADVDARADADIGPTLVPTPNPLFGDPTGVHEWVLNEPTTPHDRSLLDLTGTHRSPMPIDPPGGFDPGQPSPRRLSDGRAGVTLQAAVAVTDLAMMVGVGLGMVL